MQRTCEACGSGYEAKRPNARFCSPLCRKRASRNPALTATSAPDVALPDGDVTRSTIARLVELEVDQTPHGKVAIALARRLDSPRETGSAVAAISKQLTTMLDDLEQRGKRKADPLDELRERRRVKADLA